MRSRSRRGRGLLRLLAAFILVVALLGGLAYVSLGIPYQGFSKPILVDFPKGTSAKAMAAELAESGVIRYGWQFLVARAVKPGARLQAGEYQFTHADSTWD